MGGKLHYLSSLLCCFVALASPCDGQEYKVEQFSTKQGLSQGMIMGLNVDGNGFIWIGTLGGLNRFDGKSFKLYQPNPMDSFSISGVEIHGILEDSKGRLWVGHDKGLDCLDKKTGRFHRLTPLIQKQGINANKVSPRLETSDGHIWLSNGMVVVELALPDDFPSNPRSKSNARVEWWAIGKGIPNTNQPIILRRAAANEPLMVLGNCIDCGLLKFDRANRKWMDVPHSSTADKLSDITIPTYFDSKRNAYWAISGNSIICYKDGFKISNIALPKSLVVSSPNQWSSSLLFDGHGIGWILTPYQVIKFEVESLEANKASFQSILNNDKLDQNYRALQVDKQGSIWIGTSGYGIIHIKPIKKVFSHVLPGISIGKIIPTISENSPLLISKNQFLFGFDPQIGNISPDRKTLGKDGRQVLVANWFVSTKGYTYKLYQLKSQDYWVEVSKPNGTMLDFQIKGADHTSHFFEDRKGKVWLATNAGDICEIAPESNLTQTHSFLWLWGEGKSKVTVKHVMVDKNGSAWISTFDGLVQAKLNGAKPIFKLWSSSAKSPNWIKTDNIISTIDDPIDSDRFLWVCTNGSGIAKMDKQTGYCISYTKKDGLPDDVVYGGLVDKHNRIWLSTNNGLTCFNTGLSFFRNFTEEDGLQGSEFNTLSYHAMPNGDFIFGGVGGLTIFNPSNFYPDGDFPRVLINGLKVNYRSISERDESALLQVPIENTPKVQLKYDQNFIGISFTEIDHSKAFNSNYYYKMEGVDHDWVFSGDREEASYPNLPPGTYTFWVANVNEGGGLNPNPARLEIVISPPWWKSPLAYFLYGCLLIGLLFLFVKFQTKRLALRHSLALKEKEAAQLLELDEMKSRFFTNLTHEFRTPLTLLISPAKLLAEGRGGSNTSKLSNIILKNAERLLDMVNELLDLSKMEAGKYKFQLSETDAIELVQNIFQLFQSVAGPKMRKMYFSSSLKQLPIYADKKAIERIVYNILANAVKFTDESGVINVSISKDDEYWTLQVADNGIGISQDEQESIFERFYQTDNSNIRKAEGTGIGLAFVKEIVQMAKGSIEVESKLGEGATFKITLPIIFEGLPQVTHPKIEPISSTFSTILNNKVSEEATIDADSKEDCILVVEDNDDMRLFIEMILKNEGYKVISAENGKVGLEKAREQMPDLVLSDVMMPDMDGYEMLTILRGDLRTSHIPIVMLTAKGSLDSKLKGYGLGADAYMAKPFHPEELLVRLAQLIESRRNMMERFGKISLLNPPNQIIKNKPIQENSARNLDEDEGMSLMDQAFIANIKSYFSEHFTDEHFDFDQMAAHMNLSRTHFQRKVQALTTLTPGKLLRDIRLIEAKRLLEESPQMRVTEVMYKVGFNDSKNFSAIFKEKFGITPNMVKK